MDREGEKKKEIEIHGEGERMCLGRRKRDRKIHSGIERDEEREK